MKPKIDGRSNRHTRTRRKIFDVGVNDADYNTQPTIDGKKVLCKYYSCWRDMLERCYSEKFHCKYPSYSECYVVEEWHKFSSFKKWMEMQNWEGKQLDKDLLGDGLQYSEKYCRFISSQANSILSLGTRQEDRTLPVGVFKMPNGRYKATCKNGGTSIHIGVYETPILAHRAWQIYKREMIKTLASIEELPEIVGALNSRIDTISKAIASGKEITSWRY